MLGALAPEDNHQSAPLGHTEMVGVSRQSGTAPPIGPIRGVAPWPGPGLGDSPW